MQVVAAALHCGGGGGEKVAVAAVVLGAQLCATESSSKCDGRSEMRRGPASDDRHHGGGGGQAASEAATAQQQQQQQRQQRDERARAPKRTMSLATAANCSPCPGSSLSSLPFIPALSLSGGDIDAHISTQLALASRISHLSSPVAGCGYRTVDHDERCSCTASSVSLRAPSGTSSGVSCVVLLTRICQ